MKTLFCLLISFGIAAGLSLRKLEFHLTLPFHTEMLSITQQSDPIVWLSFAPWTLRSAQMVHLPQSPLVDAVPR